jgi:hypothetical protein
LIEGDVKTIAGRKIVGLRKERKKKAGKKKGKERFLSAPTERLHDVYGVFSY